MPALPTNYEDMAKELESLGEPQVRVLQASAKWGNHGVHKNWVDAWLLSVDYTKRDAREAEMLRVARRANCIAWIAIVAAIVSVVINIASRVF